jgi:GNAT superfamily N-acetyltransferase
VWNVVLRQRLELSGAELAERQDLGRRAWAASSEPDERYPFGITWAAPTWFALVRDADGRLLGSAGVLERSVRWGGQDLRVGGVSSVSTDPAVRGQGVASAAVGRIMDFLCTELEAHAGLLLASRMGRPVYERLGWQVVGGPLRCEQPEGPLVWTEAFADKAVMAFACAGHVLPDGEIDLNGLPW